MDEPFTGMDAVVKDELVRGLLESSGSEGWTVLLCSHDIGELDLNMSGCMNACGQHHIGHIGILGVDKNGAEWYQISIGGSQGNAAALGKVIGPSFAAHEVPAVIERLIDTYIHHRHEDERFVYTVHRLGIEPFKERVYAAAH